MNIKKLLLRGIVVFFLLLAQLCLMQCEQKIANSNEPDDSDSNIPDDQQMIRYQLFNLELAAEEAYHIGKTSNRNPRANPSNVAPCLIAIDELKEPCDFTCHPYDYECLRKYMECENTVETVNRRSSGDGDGDGAEPLPIASDTSLLAFASNLEVAIFTDEPDEAYFKLLTNDGQVYATSESLPDSYHYDKEKRHAVFKVKVENPELASSPLIIQISTRFLNKFGEVRQIEIKQPFGIIFSN